MQKTLTKTKSETVTKPVLKTKQELALDAALTYDLLNQQEKLFKARREKILRPIIEEALKLYGSTDQRGHRHLNDEDVSVTLERRATPVFNTVVAEKILTKKKLLESCQRVRTVVEIDEGKVYEAYEAGLLTAKDIDQMFSEKESFALIVSSNMDTRPALATIVDLRKRIEQGEVADMPLVGAEDAV